MTQKNHNQEKQLFVISQKALVYDANKKEYLILKAAKNKKNSPNFSIWRKTYGPWDLPGGQIDAGEIDVQKAFAREIKEEVGFTLNEVGEICKLSTVYHERSIRPTLVIIYRILYRGEDVVLSSEHNQFKWMTAEEIFADKEIKDWIKDAVRRSEELMDLGDSLNNWKRCLADFDNYKKRQSENHKEFTKYAAEGVISDILPVLDNFHAATEHIPQNDAESPWVTGIMFIQQQMEKVLEEHGVTKIEISIGDEFDPRIMEAVKNNEEKKLDENAKVQKIAQPGYRIGEKVLRAARVILK